MYQAEYFALQKDSIKVDARELKRRLSVSGDFDLSAFDDALLSVMERITPKCRFVRVPVCTENASVDLSFVKVESKDLCKNLGTCKEAYVFAVTLGHAVDRFLSRLSLISPADFFIGDAVSSALAESVCDVAERLIKGNTECKPRFSPGYGDLDLSVQKDVLSVLNAGKLLGITLTGSGLMTPQKSITAIMGIIT